MVARPPHTVTMAHTTVSTFASQHVTDTRVSQRAHVSTLT